MNLNTVFRRVAGLAAGVLTFLLAELALGALGVLPQLTIVIGIVPAALVYYMASGTKPWWSK